MEFYFGKLKVKGGVKDKYAFIRKGLTEKNMEVFHQKFRWSFVDFDEIPKDGRLFIRGRLVKYTNSKQPVVNSSRTTITNTTVNDHVAATSLFFIEKDTDMISYNPVIPHIGKNQFREVFAKIFMKVYHDSKSIKNITLDDIEKEMKEEEKNREREYQRIKKEMKELNSIKKISFTLRPSNPCNQKMWRKIDKKLKRLEARSYTVIYENEKGLLATFRGSEIYALIQMVICGYGKGEILGEKNGDQIVIDIDERKAIEDTKEESKISLEKSETDAPEEILEELRENEKYSIYVNRL